MEKDAKIYVAGHRGLVGSAILRGLQSEGYTNLIYRTHKELDLMRQDQVEAFFETERPEYVFLAAAKVGGIWANNTYPAEFIHNNLMITSHIIHMAYTHGVKRLLNLGSSCIYPKMAPQPLKEEYLLTGPLEPTNEPYAVAKIAGIILCESYNRQYGTRFISAMPNNLYGPNDNFDLETSHVLPALIRKFHLAKLASQGQWEAIEKDEARFGPIPEDLREALGLSEPRTGGSVAVPLWGTGSPLRELLHVEDLAGACLFLMNLDDATFDTLLDPQRSGSESQDASFDSHHYALINIGTGRDHTIKDIAAMVAEVVGYEGEVRWDSSKPDGTPRKLLDSSRILSLGWKPGLSVVEGIRRTYGWYLRAVGCE